MKINPSRRLRAALLSWMLIAGAASLAMAQDEAEKPDAEAARLPLSRVVLFSSGVGFFERRGEIDGDAEIDLRFRVDQINDLLKSLVLQDLDGGQISAVSYESRDPVTRTLKTFALDLTDKPTLGQLLDQARGETVEVDLPNEVRGVIVGVERRKEKVNEDETVEVEYLNLLTEQGLRQVALQSVGRIEFVNPELQAELRAALAVLATAHDSDKKSVTLRFRGTGERKVRVGYVQEAPIWKTSYRLVLGEEAPFLQGWAIVENSSDNDWTNVSLDLVSGRPISFVMDLYSPLYIPRPEVELELYSSLKPQKYDQDLGAREAEFQKRAELRKSAAPAAPMAAMARQRGMALAENAAAAAPQEADAQWRNLQQGVQTVAQAEDVGELFRYSIGAPVTIKRQSSAMLPIINDALEGEKLAIYNQQVQAKHPLNAVRLKNVSDLHLMQGPVTVFDEGVYAGDAQLPDLAPGSERLVSYALALDVEVAPRSEGKPQRLVSARLVKGTLYTTFKLERAQHYVVKNSGRNAKQVLIEYPIENEWKLLAPAEPAEKTRGVYRFAVTAKPGEAEELAVREERTIMQSVAVTNLNSNDIVIYLNAREVSDAVKDALREVVRRRDEISQIAANRQRLEQQVTVIGQEQERIRKNMEQLPQNSDLYNRYVTKFSEQEDAIEKLRVQIDTLNQEQATKQQALDQFLIGLELE